MADYVISCESTADLDIQTMTQYQLEWAPFHYELGGVTRPDDLWQSASVEDFYQAMIDGAETRTSQVSLGEYLEFFEAFLKAGKDVLHVSFSSGLSGSFASAEMAAQQLRPQYPERKLTVIDSLCASSGYGLLMVALSQKRAAGASYEDAAQWVRDNCLKVHHWFFSTDLTFYVRGGRVSKTAGFFGNMLKICPLLNVDYEGHLIPRDKIRTKKRATEAAFARMQEHVQDGADYAGQVFISQSNCYDDAKTLANLIEAAFPKMDGPVQIFPIGPTIGAHTGPGTVALFFFGDQRVD